MVSPSDAYVGTGRSRVLARMATTGIYLLRGLPRDLQRAARARALREGSLGAPARRARVCRGNVDTKIG